MRSSRPPSASVPISTISARCGCRTRSSTRPGALTADELRVIQMHPTWGLELLATVEFPWDIKPIIRWHHERYDGTGYPDRLQGGRDPG